MHIFLHTYKIVVVIVLLIWTVEHVGKKKNFMRQISDVRQFSDWNPKLPTQERVDET